MSIGNITIKTPGALSLIGAKKCNVAAGVTIYSGEPVERVLGATTVTALNTAAPVVGTDYLAGIATSNSTATATAAGTVEVFPIVPGVVYTISPLVAATFDTQAEYNALVGKRVLLDLTSGVYTILAVDGATNGCVIEPLDVITNPGKVAFSFRNAVSDLA